MHFRQLKTNIMCDATYITAACNRRDAERKHATDNIPSIMEMKVQRTQHDSGCGIAQQ
jgi:hypothetical protein